MIPQQAPQIPRGKALWREAGVRVRHEPMARRSVAVYAAVLALLSAVYAVAQYLLDDSISQTGGLQHLQLRSVLSTIDAILPLAQQLIVLCLGLGLSAVFLRVARGQTVTLHTLRAGFERLWPLVKCTLLEAAVMFAVCMASFYASALLYALSPLSSSLQQILSAADTQTLLSGGEVIVTDTSRAELLMAILPMMVLFLVVYMAVLLPILYGYRMVDYILIERPGARAREVLRASRAMMRGNRFRLFCVDLRLWWYYALLAVAGGLAYLDVVLSALNVTLPISSVAAYFLSYALCLAAQAAVYCLARPRVDATYALAYDAIAPKPAPAGVVLGNIFDLAKDDRG